MKQSVDFTGILPGFDSFHKNAKIFMDFDSHFPRAVQLIRVNNQGHV